MNRADLLDRLSRVEQRLAEHSSAELTGLTEPDPGGTERWEAGQVWAHLAEFPTYWLNELHRLLAAAAAGEPQPIPFGRLKTDPDRIAAIERDRHESAASLLARVREGVASAVAQLDGMSQDELSVRGLHPTLGDMQVGRILERFVVEHLEEHAAQLDSLAAR